MTLPLANLSTSRKVITTIHENWLDGKPFALRDVARAATVSSSSAVRTLRKLKAIRLIAYSEKAYAGRHYRVNKLPWSQGVPHVIETFEYAKLLKML